MTAKKQETAEQKLLKMIEATSGKPPAAAASQKKVEKKANVLATIRIANYILILAIIGLLALIGLDINVALNAQDDQNKISLGKMTMSDALTPEQLIPGIKKLTLYLANVKRRNLFAPYEEARQIVNTATGEKMSEVAKATAKFRLVGISWLDNIDSASAMLEDTEKNITYFLQKGEKIGDIIVQTIYADGVELGYENEEIIIRYDKSQM